MKFDLLLCALETIWTLLRCAAYCPLVTGTNFAKNIFLIIFIPAAFGRTATDRKCFNVTN